MFVTKALDHLGKRQSTNCAVRGIALVK